MRASEVLKHEHRLIEQMLGCLEKLAEQAHSSGTLDTGAASKMIDFFRNFADGCHHAKEEAHFFPAMEARGFPREAGPTGVMLYEHQRGREFIAGMDEAVKTAREEPQAVTAFVQHARGYVHLLREHILKEDTCLFAMADQAFSEDDQERLSAAFEQVEKEDVGEGTHQRYEALVGELSERFGVSPQRAGAASHPGYCGH